MLNPSVAENTIGSAMMRTQLHMQPASRPVAWRSAAPSARTPLQPRQPPEPAPRGTLCTQWQGRLAVATAAATAGDDALLAAAPVLLGSGGTTLGMEQGAEQDGAAASPAAADIEASSGSGSSSGEEDSDDDSSGGARVEYELPGQEAGSGVGAGGSWATSDEPGLDEEAFEYYSKADLRNAVGQEAATVMAREVWDVIAEARGAVPTVAAIESTFPFALDAFQRQALAALLAGKSCLTCAPTGAGKTAIAEAAAVACLAAGQRVIYTTPLKALSNQKLLEMRKRFGADCCGLQTGDASVQPDARVVVMTTEILRNIMYRSGSDAEQWQAQGSAPAAAGSGSGSGGDGFDAGARGGSAAEGVEEDPLSDVGLVVLDEVHYLGDRSRGSVWEEVIIGCPPHVQLLAMSATVKNPHDLGGWIAKVHGSCETVVSRQRPVPLTWHFCHTVRGQNVMLHLATRSGKRLNPELLPQEPKKLKGGGHSSRALQYLAELDDGRSRKGKAGQQQQWWAVDPSESPAKRVPVMEEVLAALVRQEMLPAIWFIFSRRDCDLSAQRMARAGFCLTSPAERAIIQAELSTLQASQPEAIKEGMVEPLLAGLASHHAGLLPAWKTLVEGLFQQGVLKVVFATETLAAGINMPARTAVLSSLARRRDGAIALLKHNELMQMAGRAGRRGYDEVGHVVLLQTRFEGPREAWGLLSSGPEPLSSQFAAGYGMALNLLASRSLEDARAFVARSFNNYLGGEGMQRRLAEIEEVEAAARAVMLAGRGKAKGKGKGLPLDVSAKAEADAFAQYNKLTERRRAEKRALRVLRTAMAEARGAAAAARLVSVGLPCLVTIDVGDASPSDDPRLGRLLAMAVGVRQPPGDDGEGATYLCLSVDNRLLLTSPTHVTAVGRLPADHPSVAGIVGAVLAQEANADGGSGGGISWQRTVPGLYAIDGTATTAPSALGLLTLAERVGAGNAIPAAGGEGGGGPGTSSSGSGRGQFACLSDVAVPQELQQAVQQQAARLAQVKRELRELSRDGASTNRGAKKAVSAAARAAKLMQRARAMRLELDSALDSTWQEFENVVAVLVKSGALAEGSLQPLPLGAVARNMSGDNELWMATLFTHSALQGLSSAQLAAVVCGIVAPAMVSKPNVWVCYPPSPGVLAIVEQLQEAQQALYELQVSHDVAASLAVDLRCSGLAEAWASGCSWQQIMADSSLDDGDIARLLGRTVDVLRQASYVQQLAPGMRASARAAVRAMNRAPISDLVV